MKPKNKNAIRGILFITALSLLGFDFKPGEMVELTYALNARKTPRFYRTNLSNRRFVLGKGATGEIKKVVKLPSGNYGVKLTLTNGKRQGKTAWVYYNVHNPGLKLSGSRSADTAETAETAQPTQPAAQDPRPARPARPAPIAAASADAEDSAPQGVEVLPADKVPSQAEMAAANTDANAASAKDTDFKTAALPPRGQVVAEPIITDAKQATTTREQEALESKPEDTEQPEPELTKSKIDLASGVTCYHAATRALGIPAPKNFPEGYVAAPGVGNRKEPGIFLYDSKTARFYPIAATKGAGVQHFIGRAPEDFKKLVASGDPQNGDRQRAYLAQTLASALDIVGRITYTNHYLSTPDATAEEKKQAEGKVPKLDPALVKAAADTCAKVKDEPHVSGLAQALQEMLEATSAPVQGAEPKGKTEASGGQS